MPSLSARELRAHYQRSRPRGGACHLDFLDVWVWQAIRNRDDDAAYRYARQIGHWAILMHPELAQDR